MSSEGRKSEAPAARFADVTPRKLRAPSWVSAQRHPANRLTDTPSLKPPRLPEEFVHAIRQGIEHKTASRYPAAPSVLAPAPAAAAEHAVERSPASSRTQPVAERVVPTVDPELNQAFQNAIEELARTRDEIVEHTAGQIAELAIAIARRVLAHELSIEPRLVLGLVNEGLEALGDWERVRIRLGSCFADVEQELVQRISRSGQRCEVMIDPALSSHGCVVETDLGRVDESVEVRLATLLQALKPDSDVPV
jgi:flagellar biosynthesis/type III secretory pathway protein FliH